MQPLLQVQQNAINRAVELLTGTGCQFKVIATDGSEYGELVAEVKKAVTRKKVNNFKATGYIEIVTNMQPKQTHVFIAPEGVNANSFRSAISGCASRVHGVDSCNTTVIGNTIEFVRIK